ncbi:hypothetical protein AHF37_03001 [Paragonimus kellicotti]|nr:hypothetical protein AHF37_03001 [Paragonimus kellicotti]
MITVVQVVNTALNLSPTLPPIRNCVRLDVESALTAAAALAVGASLDINEGVPSNATVNQVLESTAAVTSQTYNPGYPLFGSTGLSQLMQTNGLYLSPMLPAYPQLGMQPSEPMFNADNFSLYRTTTQLNPALFPGGASLLAPHPFASNLSTNFTAAYPSYNNYAAVTLSGGASSAPLTSAQPALNCNWFTPYTAGSPYGIFTTMEQFARSFIRVKGLPFDADITDILVFLEDHRYSVALHGVHQVYSPLLQFFANANCPVQYGEAGVLFVNRRSGQATGDAFVMFETQSLAAEALKSHRQHIGNRYIELFKSTPAEVNQVVNTALNLSPTLPPIRNCVRLDVESALTAAAALAVGASLDINEGVPSNATVNQVLESTAAVTSNIQSRVSALWVHGSLSVDANKRTTTQLNPALFPGGASLLAPHPFASNLSTNFTAAYPSYNNYAAVTLSGGASSAPLTSAQPALNCNWFTPYTAGSPYGIFTTMEQFARSFIRVKGLPFDADITDILVFLEDHRYSVALHGVHQVYSPLGLPTGEAIIQLLSEFVAQRVVQQKHGSLFVRPGCAGPACIVEVTQCNVEDLRQLLATMLAIVQANVENEYLPALNSHMLQARIPEIRSIFSHTHPYLASHAHLSNPMVAPANQMNPVMLSSGLHTASANSPALMVSMMDRRIQSSDTQSTVASYIPTNTIKGAHSLIATEQTNHHPQAARGGTVSYASLMSHLICQPSQTLLNNVLPIGTLASSFIPLTPSAGELFGHLKPSIQPLNVFGQPGVNLINPAQERGTVMENQRIANTSRHRQTVPTPQPEKLLVTYPVDEESQVTVYLEGLPKDVSCSEITSLFIEHDVKPFSIRLDYAEDGLATGNASVHLSKQSDAEYLVNHVGKLWLREHQVNVNMENPRQRSS